MALPLTVTLSEPSNLELAHWYAAGELEANGWYKGTPSSYAKQGSANTAGLYTAFHLNNAAKTLVHNDAAIGGSNALYADVTITIVAPADGYTDPSTGTEYSKADIASMLNGQYVDVTVEKVSTSRAKFFSLGTSAVAAAANGATSVTENTTGFQLSDLGDSGTILHVGMYVEGDNAGTPETGDAISAEYKVTISAHA